MIAKTKDDRGEKLWRLPCLHQKSLVSELCETQKYAQPVEKTHEWAKELLCLCSEQSRLGHNFRKSYKHALQREVVAVSWTWQPSKEESSLSGEYYILPPNENKIPELQNVGKLLMYETVDWTEWWSTYKRMG